MMNAVPYLEKKTDNIYNLLVLIENDTDSIDEITEHIHSLCTEMTGATKIFTPLAEDVDYLTVLSMLGALNCNMKFKDFRRSVLRMCSLLNKISRRMAV